MLTSSLLMKEKIIKKRKIEKYKGDEEEELSVWGDIFNCISIIVTLAS